MISENLKKRFYTSIVLFFLFFLSFNYLSILILSLILIFIISIVELYNLIIKIFYKRKINSIILKFFFMCLGFFYILLFVITSFIAINNEDTKKIMLFLLFICIMSDLGGIVFGKVFKGRKLSKISPNKTISGSVGSFIFSIFLVPVITLFSDIVRYNLLEILFFVIIISFFNQIGDLFVSYLKRKANVKDTGKILPGHGGILDRIDGMLLAIPIGVFLWSVLNLTL
jgi:phosphatidate cytidylyltransferase